MKFKTSELKNFIQKCKSVRNSHILPILSYIKWENGVLTKTNLETFFSSKVSTDGAGAFLLDEKILTEKLKNISSEFIDIDLDGKYVVINGNGLTKFPSVDVKSFPVFPEGDKKDSVTLDEPVVSSLSVFSAFTMNPDQENALCYVHLTKDGMFVSNHTIYGNREFFAGIPDIILSREACNTLAVYNELEYYSNDRYNFFSNGNDSMAIIKPEKKTPASEFNRIFSDCKKEVYFEVEKKELLAFCDYVSAICSKLLPECVFSIKDHVINLSFSDPDFDSSENRDVEGVGKFEVEKLIVNPKHFGSFLRQLPYNEIRISPYGDKDGMITIWTTEDEQFTGIFMGLKYN